AGTGLDLGRIGAGQRTVQPVFRAMRVEPAPDGALIPLRSGDVNGLAMTVAAGPGLAAVQGVAGPRLEARRNALAIVVAERAQDRPADAGGIHRSAGMVELLAEIRIHAADHVSRHRQTKALGRGRILPGEVAGRIPLGG